MTTRNRQPVSAAPGSDAFARYGDRVAIGTSVGVPEGEGEWAAVAIGRTRLAAPLT
jgi:hypothetical protein